jgi:hypothetical protein
MVLGFTGSLSVAQADRLEVRTMLVGAIGCNLAWGIIDGIFYLMGGVATRGRGLLALRAVRSSGTPQAAHKVIAEALPPIVAEVLDEGDLEKIRLKLNALADPPPRAVLDRDDYMGALSTGLLVFLSTFPVVLPFLFMSNARLALRISNGIAITMLFIAGYRFGVYAGRRRPWVSGLVSVALGVALVLLTIQLGG